MLDETRDSHRWSNQQSSSTVCRQTANTIKGKLHKSAGRYRILVYLHNIYTEVYLVYSQSVSLFKN